ncbi:hypothetical protein GM668_21430, partial [Duganella ginsengisoli]|nr:hypothetical protein [Pseudoduganella ginsengisoli]
MSLLMQALKKAERNKLDPLPEDDGLELSDESFDRVVALTPDDVLSGRVPPAPDLLALSLEPLEELQQPAGSVSEQVPALEPAIPAPHDPTPPQSRRHGAQPSPAAGQALEGTGSTSAPGVDLPFSVQPPPLRELALEDVAPPPVEPFVAEMLMARETAAALATEPIAPLPALETAALALDTPAIAEPYRAVLDAYASADAMPPAPAQTAKRAASGQFTRSPARKGVHTATAAETGGNHAGTPLQPPLAADTADGSGQGAAQASTRGAAHGNTQGAARGTAARARAAAQAAAEQDQPRRDPARVRLAVLGGALALVAGTLAGVYWYALTSPGPGASLPPVPMPAPGAATGAAPVTVVPPAGALPAADGTQPVPSGPETPQLTPDASPDTLHPATGYTGLPQARPAPPAPPAQHGGGSRMPSDDDLQHALQ